MFALLHGLTHPSYSAWNEDLQVEEDDQVERVVDRTSLDGKIRAIRFRAINLESTSIFNVWKCLFSFCRDLSSRKERKIRE